MASRLSCSTPKLGPIWRLTLSFSNMAASVKKNTIIDDNYRIIDIIDWDRCFAPPWKAFASLPNFVPCSSWNGAPSRYVFNILKKIK